MPDDAIPAGSSSEGVIPQGAGATDHRRLSRFIADNTPLIVGEWEDFARSLMSASAAMTPNSLRDHIIQILAFVVPDMERAQSPAEQRIKSLGDRDSAGTAAETHAALRLAGGFDIGQMVSEYRALRASVLKLWSRSNPAFDVQDIADITRFNEAIDQAVAESVNFYTAKVARSKDMVLGILAHDLRTPIQAILLSAELLLHMGALNARQRMLIGKLLESGQRMGDLVNNLLDVTRARFGGGLPVARGMMDMGFIGQQIIDEIRLVHPKRTIELAIAGELTGEWDKARIGQVFSNLLGNAIQYGFQGSPIHVDLRGISGTVTLTVQNLGVPIAEEKITTIFDPLTRGARDEGMPLASNLGLGLYITREVVIAHGGTIDVTSSELEGTVFTAVFPPSPAAP